MVSHHLSWCYYVYTVCNGEIKFSIAKFIMEYIPVGLHLSLFITLNIFRLEHNILLNNCFVFTLKQFSTIQHQKQVATESGCVQIRTFATRCQHVKGLYYVYIYVWLIHPALWSNFPSYHFAYVNNHYNIELGHKSHDQYLIRNIKH